MEKELIGYNNEIEDRIFRKYSELRVKKGLCRGCKVIERRNGGRPVSFFVVGKDFQKQKFRIMFVGKTVQDGWESEPIDKASDFIDARNYSREQLFLPFWSTYPFWQCIKEICQILWKRSDPEDMWRRIAITNLVKCSSSPDLDTTPELLKRNCILNAAFFENEVKIAQPTHMILFTGSDYDEYLHKVSFGYDYKDGEKITLSDVDVKMWQRDFFEANKVKMRFLRTYHPGFFKFRGAAEKWKFCQAVAQWITHFPI